MGSAIDQLNRIGEIYDEFAGGNLNGEFSTTAPVMGKLKFPLEESNLYQGRIVFSAYREDYKTVAATGFNLFSNEATKERKSRREALTNQGITDERLINAQLATQDKQISDLYQSPADKDTRPAIPNHIGNGKRSCTLYLPSQIQFQDRIEYTNVDLNILGQSAANALRSGASGAETVRRVVGDALPSFESLSEAVRSGLSSEAAQVAALRVSRRLNSEVAGAIETTTGVTLNPNRRQTLKGVGIRQFRFQFKMIPTTQAEANMITNIIKFFREEMYPETSSEGVQAALKFPSKFNIKMMYGNKQVTTGILPCFLENIDVVYNPSNMGFHKDGTGGGDFQETDVSLSFVEERALTKRDIVFGGY